MSDSRPKRRHGTNHALVGYYLPKKVNGKLSSPSRRRKQFGAKDNIIKHVSGIEVGQGKEKGRDEEPERDGVFPTLFRGGANKARLNARLWNPV